MKSKKQSNFTEPLALGSTIERIRWKSISPCLSCPTLYPREIKQFLNFSGLRRPVRDLSKWLKEARNSLSCSCVMPLLSRVKIWFSTSLIVLLTDVTSCSQPTLRVSVLKDKALLDLLVDPLQFLKMWLELVDCLFVFPQPTQLLLQRSLHSHANGCDSIHLSLDPGSNLVGLLCKLSSEGFVIFLLLKFVLQSLIS